MTDREKIKLEHPDITEAEYDMILTKIAESKVKTEGNNIAFWKARVSVYDFLNDLKKAGIQGRRAGSLFQEILSNNIKDSKPSRFGLGWVTEVMISGQEEPFLLDSIDPFENKKIINDEK